MTRFLILTFLMLSTVFSPFMLSAKAESLGNLAKYPTDKKNINVSTSADGMPRLAPTGNAPVVWSLLSFINRMSRCAR